MKRPWQIWTLFALCLAIALPAMVWLTVKAVKLDADEALARRQLDAARRQAECEREKAEFSRQRAELEEDIGRALWRMDTWLTPLIAQESARPYFVYQTLYAVRKPGQGKTLPAIENEVSPLVVNPSEHILLNWELNDNNELSSPQVPVEPETQSLALANGSSIDAIGANKKRVVTLQEQIDYGKLWERLPDKNLPTLELDAQAYFQNVDLTESNNSVMNSVNTLGLGQLDQQVQDQIDFAQRQQKQATQQQERSAPQQTAGSRQGGQGQPSPQTSAQAIMPRETQPGESQQAELAQKGQQSSALNASPLPQQAAAQRYNNSRDEQTVMMRGSAGFERRNRALQYRAQQDVFNQRQNFYQNNTFENITVEEGISRPLWLGTNLLLARRVVVGKKVVVQGCWLDWPRLKRDLIAEVADLLPDADLVAVNEESEVTPARMLATLPVQLVVPQPVLPSFVDASQADGSPAPISPIRMSLWIAWTCMLLATVAVAILLRGVVSLSERRGAFVAAVTHELRTPLTTFRMYAEMLAEGMLPDPAKRQRYLETLRVEADRLTHLVSNVLSYARLERGRRGGRREDVSVCELVERAQSRFSERAEQAEMTLLVAGDEEVQNRQIHTDPAAVEQILFNLVDNACKYAAGADKRQIHLELESAGGGVVLRVKDHGPGVSPDMARRLFRPFSKSVDEAANTAPGVGLGLALCRRLARELGGRLEYETSDGDGASFALWLRGK